MMHARTAHIAESAELYALGTLEPFERATVDAHVADCASCLRSLAQAEETVLALSREYGEVAAPKALDRRMHGLFKRSSPSWGGVAAAFVVGLFLASFPWALDRAYDARAQNMHQSAVLAMIDSHFAHAQFAGIGANKAPLAKVIYARDRSWVYVIVSSAQSYDVIGIAPGVTRSLGPTVTRGATSELFLAHAPRMDSIVLRAGNRPIAVARIR